ncbi:beta-1,4-N-acetylgalactosaminyltransferase 3 isoform X2 [Pangasianodon hypophthalmus]|uniref:beta-1,4-N-acetylgalactosaminyltransferase 3 isoform X2 n=1 Tax=Pangasianodon hypophthalmus TaxID=310915 RepID=UPI0014811180|nr:beta-1,4-N-acetylgalactosaminyltransferase 3 isoform X2 [Pangasianodon hypophthalmus]
MKNQLDVLRVFFSYGKLGLYRTLLVFLIMLIVFTCFVFYRNEGKKGSNFEFWDSPEDTQSSETKTIQNGQPKWKPEFLGQVNMHIFEDWCGGSVDQLRKDELFPLFPHSRTTIRRLAVHPGWENYGLRIFGYIHPLKSGEYVFAIASDENSEFWLSSDNSTKKIKLMAFLGKAGNEWAAPGEYEKFASQISEPVELSKTQRYYFEIIYKQSEEMDHVELAWRLNKEESNFEVITSEYLSLYSDESSLLAVDSHIIPQTAASQRLSPDPMFKPEVDMVKEDPRDASYKIPLLQESHLENVFPKCAYYPIYIYENSTIERYDGVNHVRYSSVYPNDYTRLANEDIKGQICFYEKDEAYEQGGGFGPYLKFEKTGDDEERNMNQPNWKQVINVKPVDFHSKQSDFVTQTCKRAGNIIMLQKDVMPVIKAFKNQLMSTANSSDLVLKRVLNVEKKTKAGVGSRYLLEMEMEDKEGKNVLISKYFYTTHNQRYPELPGLCSPTDFPWNPEAKVHVILTVKNQGRWVMHFIREMEKVYQITGDKNFNVIIVDYNSSDIDVEKELKNANLPSYQFKSLDGRFAKSLGIQVGVDLVEDDNSILFMCDLHIHFPPSILDNVRKHCVQGKMVYAPVVMRLECGATVHAPTGFWETEGYGLVGIYKSDMVRIGGMNVKEYTDKWGGEDWELLDRILLHKLEVERLHLRNFVHFFHSKRGMWNME